MRKAAKDLLTIIVVYVINIIIINYIKTTKCLSFVYLHGFVSGAFLYYWLPTLFTSRLTYTQFFQKLSDFYLDKSHCGYSVKFYLQESTFSFEIQKSEHAFGGEPVFESDVYNFWSNNMDNIVRDIEEKLKELTHD